MFIILNSHNILWRLLLLFSLTSSNGAEYVVIIIKRFSRFISNNKETKTSEANQLNLKC